METPATCQSCARYFPEDGLCNPPAAMLAAIRNLGIPVTATELPVTPNLSEERPSGNCLSGNCLFWTDAERSDRFRLLRHDMAQRATQAVAS